MPPQTAAMRRASLNVYLVALALICVIPMLVVSAYATWRTGNAYKQTATARLSDTALTLASSIESDIDSHFTALSVIASLWPLQTQSGTFNLTSSRFDGIGLDGQVQVVEVFDGEVAATLSPAVAEVALRSAERDAPMKSNLVPGGSYTEHRIHLAMPVGNKGEPNDRIVVLSIPPGQLIHTLQQREDALTGILVAVTDGNGRIVARSRDPEKVVGMTAPDWKKLEALGTDSGWFEARTTEGLSTVLSFQKLKGPEGWTLVVGEPLDVFNARWQTPFVGLLLGSVLALSFATLAVIKIGGLIRRPVEALAAHSMAVANGDGSSALAPIPPSSVCEFETLRTSVEAAEAARRENDRRLRTVASAGALVFWRWSPSGNIMWVEGWETLTGVPDHEALGMAWLDRVHPDDRDRVVETFRQQVGEAELVDIEFRLLVAGERWLWVRDRGGPVIDDAGDVLQWAGVLEDIDARKCNEARIAYMALHDALTDLGNRTLLRDRLDQAAARAGRGEISALMAMDLDRFKQVNDTFGHPVGDALLREVADRLRSSTRDVDHVARLGGDEFAILQHDVEDTEVVLLLAARIIAAVSAPYEIDGHTITIGASIGMVLIDAKSPGVDEFMRRADKALYRAKENGRGQAAFYSHTGNIAAN